MDAVRSGSFRARSRIMPLLDPPFDQSAQEPGYIKAYPPGIRENGGQYTHAAVWMVMALARLGSGDEAAELFHMLNPVNHTRTADGPASLQDRAVCRGRRRVRAGAARGSRRVELVHGLGGLDVSRRPRKPARAPAARRHVQRQPVHPVVLARASKLCGGSSAPATRSPSPTPNGAATESSRAELDGLAVDGRRSRSWTTAACITCES